MTPDPKGDKALMKEAADLLDTVRYEDDGACASCRECPHDPDGFEGWEIVHKPDCLVTRLRTASETVWDMAEGFALVPIDPTLEMQVAGTEQWLCEAAMEDRSAANWKAMISAYRQTHTIASTQEQEP